MKLRSMAACSTAAVLALHIVALDAQAQTRPIRGLEQPNPCGNIFSRHYGPYDYRTERHRITVVEEFHFTPEMEAGIRGVNGPVGSEITYTLKAAPNHHRALVTLMNITGRAKSDTVTGLEWPAECYFERAIRYAYDDHIVRMLYAQFLHQRKRSADAIRQLEVALSFADKDNAFTQYNVGKLFLEIGQPARALEQAQKALELGFPRQDLIDALKKGGHWKEPMVVTSSSAPDSSASSATPR